MTTLTSTDNSFHHIPLTLGLTALICLLTACDDSDTPSADGTSSLSCTGNRVWTSGPSDTNPQIEDLISEGGPQVDVPASSAHPCAIVWEYNATLNCSTAYTMESFFDEETARSISITVSGANVVLTNDADSQTATPSGISLQQLLSAPDC